MWYMASFSYAAGYLHIIEQMKDLIKAAGKKSYTLVMGRPNSTKLANFPEVLLSSNMFSLLFMLRITDSPFFFFFFWYVSVKFLFMFLVPKLLYWIAKIF